MAYLDEWALIEREHSNSLSGVIEDLEASTLRLPVTGGARVCGFVKNLLKLVSMKRESIKTITKFA